MAFVRKRLSSSRRYGETYSYQVIETYREKGKVKQRVLVNLGRFSTAAEALNHERQEHDHLVHLSQQRPGFPHLYGRRRAKRLAEWAESIRAGLVKSETQVAALENVVSRLSLRNDFPDTTPQNCW